MSLVGAGDDDGTEQVDAQRGAVAGRGHGRVMDADSRFPSRDEWGPAAPGRPTSWGAGRRSTRPSLGHPRYGPVTIAPRASRESNQMRPLRYSINVTLDGCCHHEAGCPPTRSRWLLDRRDGTSRRPAFGRVTYEMMESAWRRPATGTWPDWMDEWEVPFAETIDRTKKYVVSSTLSGVDWNAELVRGDLGQAVQRLKQEPGEGLFVGGVRSPGVGRSGTDRRVRVPRAAGPGRTRADVARRSARAHPARAGGSPGVPLRAVAMREPAGF